MLITLSYQSIIIIPAFFLASCYAKHFSKKNTTLFSLLKEYVVIAILCLCFLIPIYVMFLRKFISAGVTHWNKGINGEYLYSILSENSWYEQFIYSVKFFTYNFWEVFAYTTALVPDTSLFFIPTSILLLVLLMIGVVYFYQQKNYTLLLVLAYITCAWLCLILLGKITLSPTRHNLVLLPAFLFLIGGGVAYVYDKYRAIPALLFILFIGLFFLNYTDVMTLRKRHYNEKTFVEIIKNHPDIDKILSYRCSYDHFLFKNIGKPVDVIPDEFDGYKTCTTWSFPYPALNCLNEETKFNKVLIYSVAEPISSKQLEQIKFAFKVSSIEDLKIVTLNNIASNTEMDFCNKTKNISNNFYCYLISKE